MAILGSGRRRGNTEILIREALEGAGCQDVWIHALSEIDFRGCVGCLGCREEGSEGCVVEDDMQDLYAEIKDADALVLGSPVYYGEITGLMKSFMDRWYALKDADRELRIRPGVKALFILVQGAPAEGHYAGVAKRLDKVLGSYGMEPEVLVAAGLEEKGEASEHPEILARAREAGRRLAAGRTA